ncbi:unnamed protein product, partial [Ectocarpus sp. 4 AP-2014]
GGDGISISFFSCCDCGWTGCGLIGRAGCRNELKRQTDRQIAVLSPPSPPMMLGRLGRFVRKVCSTTEVFSVFFFTASCCTGNGVVRSRGSGRRARVRSFFYYAYLLFTIEESRRG